MAYKQTYSCVALFLMAAMLLLPACSASTPAPAPADVPGQTAEAAISFAAPRRHQAAYEALLAAFEREHPAIQVHFVAEEDLLHTADASPTEADTPLVAVMRQADTAMVPATQVAAAPQGALTDLAPFIDADATFDATDYFSSTRDLFIQGNARLGIPLSIDAPILRSNQTLWQDHGVAPPASPSTWTEMLRLATEVTQAADAQPPVYGISDGSDGAAIFIGTLFEQQPAALPQPLERLRLTSDAIAATLDQAAGWAHNGIIYTPLTAPESGALGQVDQAVRQGQIALWPYAMTHDVADTLAFATALLPRPALPQPLSIDTRDALVISRGSQQPQAAWRWLAFLSRQPLETVVTNPRVAPARRSLLDHSDLWDHLDAEARQVVLNALAQAPPSRASLDQAALTALRAAWHAALEGTAADEALRTAQTALDTARAQHAATSLQTTVPPFVVAAPPSRTASAGATTIAFGAFADNPTMIRQLITAFQADNPDIVVDLTVSYAANMSGDAAALAETLDCFTTSGFPVSTIVTTTLDLQPLIDADSSIDADDISQQLRAPYRHGNAVHGLPYLVQLQTLSYNPRLFAAAGLPIPTVTWTRADVLAAAEALTQKDDTAPQYGYADSATQLVNLVFFLKLFGADLARVTAAGVEPTLNDPAVQAIAADYVTLLRRASPHEKIMGYEPPMPEQEVLGTLIQDGRVAMWLNLGSVGWEPESRRPDVAVAPLPLGEYDAGVQIIEPVSSFYISAQTTQQQACWRLFRAISDTLEIVRLPGPEGQTIFPARRSVVEAMAANAQTPSGAHDVYLTYLDVLEHTPLQRDSSP